MQYKELEAKEIVPQKSFMGPDEFASNIGGFMDFFLPSTAWGKSKRKLPVFLRFEQKYPTLEHEITSAVSSTNSGYHHGNSSPNYPYAKMFEAYSLMGNLVSINDPGVVKNGVPDENYLLMRTTF